MLSEQALPATAGQLAQLVLAAGYALSPRGAGALTWRALGGGSAFLDGRLKHLGPADRRQGSHSSPTADTPSAATAL